MCVWFQYQGKPCEVMATVAEFSKAHEDGVHTLRLDDVYVALDGEQYVEARGHAWLHGRTMCNENRTWLQPGAVVKFGAKIHTYFTLNNTERRLGFKAIHNVQYLGDM